MKKILLTGFEPFQKESLNPSAELLRKDFGAGVDTLLLPVSFARGFAVLASELQKTNYDFILLMGQAGGRKNVGLEKIAINLMDSEVGDEDGVYFSDEVISPAGPSALISQLPLRGWQAKARGAGLEFEISTTAGLFVCNAVYYRAREWLMQQGLNPDHALFMHLPYMPEQIVGKPGPKDSLSLPEMEKILRFVLAEIAAIF